MAAIRKWLVGTACAVAAGGAFAVSSNVKVNDISFKLTDLDPNDGVDPAIVPMIDYYSDAQEFQVINDANFAFFDSRCSVCPVIIGQAETFVDEKGRFTGRTLAPSSGYINELMTIEGLFGVTRATQVTVSFDVSFNDGLVGPIGGARLDLEVVGYTLFPDRFEAARNHSLAVSLSAGEHATVEATFSNLGDPRVAVPLRVHQGR